MLMAAILALLTAGCSASSADTGMPKPTVRVIYATPSDRAFRQDFEEAIHGAVYDVQAWYAGTTGRTDILNIGAYPTALRPTERRVALHRQGGMDGGGLRAKVGFYATLRTARRLIGARAIPRGVVYPDVNSRCDGSSIGAGTHGITVLHRASLSGLVNPSYQYCGFPPVGPEGWIGLLAHEVGTRLWASPSSGMRRRSRFVQRRICNGVGVMGLPLNISE